ncbi:MAG: cytidylate kinase-like family protein [Desulfobacteraceae bacterium]|nr:MAG: cytidylate kinase-like family protein [Desulfobacteraceae bacterium]
MTIIAISSESYRRGREIGEKTAKKLGYRYLDREIIEHVAEKSGISREKLIKALDKTPSVLGMSQREQTLYLAHMEQAVVEEFLKDNVVCHGMAAHLYVLGVSHVLKVRILCPQEDLVREIAEGKNLSGEALQRALKRFENFRRRWSLKAFSVDETDPGCYDMVISLNKIETGEAVNSIVEAAGYKKFKAMSYSIKCLRDEEIASRARTILLPRFPDAKVRASGSTIVVETKGMKREKRRKSEMIKEMAGKIDGVKYVEVHVVNDIFRQAAQSFR